MVRNAVILIFLIMAAGLVGAGLAPFGVPRALVYGLGLYLVAYVYARVTR
jgi:hypothetical protein